jgi:hypothetical protein
VDKIAGAVLVKKMGEVFGSLPLPLLTALSPEVFKAELSEDHPIRTIANTLKYFSLLEIAAMFHKVGSLKPTPEGSTPAMDMLRHGDGVTGGTPCFEKVKNPFVLSQDWHSTIESLVAELREQGVDTETLGVSEPTPVSPLLLPNLYFGWGSAPQTHTPRQILQNRLGCLLLNRLSVNDSESTGEKFRVQLTPGSTEMTRPCQFLEALQSQGDGWQKHSAVGHARVLPTSFGVGLCVKAKSQEGALQWINIPLGASVRSGLFDPSNPAREAQLLMGHAGFDLDVEGPLVQFNVQQYISVEGFNGWHSNHNVAIHWLLDQKQCGEPFRGIELLRAVRIAGIAAVVSNTVADDRRIPVGGYGQVGICHDSVGIVEQAVRGSTQVFPNVATPEAHLQMLHKTATLATVLAGRGAPQEVLDDVKCLAKAFADVPNDIVLHPGNIKDTVRRMRHAGLPPSLFLEEMTGTEAILDALQATSETWPTSA